MTVTTHKGKKTIDQPMLSRVEGYMRKENDVAKATVMLGML